MVTGHNPPSTPVTAEMYKNLGFPFYKLWGEEPKNAGVAGSWGSIVGAKEVASVNAKGGVSSSALKSVGKVKEPEVEQQHEFEDRSFDFPVKLIDVDDTIAEFRSVVDESDDDSEEFY